MPQSLHVLSAHIIFSTKRRHPWLIPDIRERIWAYQSRILQNMGCSSITIGGVADHVHVLCNLTKEFPTTKVLEILKKDSSKFAKTLNSNLRDFHWQDGYGLFGVSPSHFEPVRKYILNQEEHHKKETFQEKYLRILKKYCAPWVALSGRIIYCIIFRGRCPRLQSTWPFRPVGSFRCSPRDALSLLDNCANAIEKSKPS